MDVILFLNNEQPPFSKVLDEWEDIFLLTEGLDVRDIRKTDYSIQFNFQSYEFDLLPAPNFAHSSGLSSEERIKLQRNKTLEKIAEKIAHGRDQMKYNYLYSSALAESVLQFIRKQEGFVNEMIRIAKFWYKTLHIPDYVSGAKSFIELVAVRAAHIERSSGASTKKMHLRTFGRILDFIINFDSIRVIFYDEYEIPAHRSVARQMDAVRPCLLDPSNPYNNLARNFVDKPRMKDLLIGYARETKNRLYQVMDGRWQMDVDAIAITFEPQPRMVPDLPRNIKNASFLLSSETKVSGFPDKTIRNNRIRTDFIVLHALDLMQLYFTILIEIYKTNEAVTLSDAKEHLKQMVNRSVSGYELPWIPSLCRDEDFDVTFTLPFRNKGSLKISLKDLYD